MSEDTSIIQSGPQIWLEDYQGKRKIGDGALRKELIKKQLIRQRNLNLTWDKVGFRVLIIY